MIHVHHIQSPVEVITLSLNIPQEYKYKCIEEVYRLGDTMNNKTNLKCIMSSYNIWNESQVFNLLLDNIYKTIDKISRSSQLIDKDISSTFKMVEAWSAIYKEGHYALPHSHKPYQISFVYYLKSNGNTPLVFNNSKFEVIPMDDMLVIFPSYITHNVPKHIGKEDRICIAGNLNWVQK